MTILTMGRLSTVSWFGYQSVISLEKCLMRVVTVVERDQRRAHTPTVHLYSRELLPLTIAT